MPAKSKIHIRILSLKLNLHSILNAKEVLFILENHKRLSSNGKVLDGWNHFKLSKKAF